LNGGFKREKASAEKPGKASRQALGVERIFGKLFLLVLVLVHRPRFIEVRLLRIDGREIE
jgi:hypothetical protein